MNAIFQLRLCKFFRTPLIALIAFVLIPMTSAKAASCHFYQVNLQGTVTLGDGAFISANEPFSVYEYAMWRDAGVASHPVEFYLTPLQDLNASAQVGQIELMTNSAFARNAGIASARYDLATVSVSNVISFEIDSGMSLQLPPPNVLIAPGFGTVPGGLGGLGFLTGAGSQLAELINSSAILSLSYFVPRAGGGYFYSPDGGWATIAGEIQLVGSGIDNPSFQGEYSAVFSGSYVGSVECN